MHADLHHIQYQIEGNFFRVVRYIYKYNISIINNVNGSGQGCDTHVQELTKHLVNSCDSWDGGMA